MVGKSRGELENLEHHFRLNWLLHDLWKNEWKGSLFPPSTNQFSCTRICEKQQDLRVILKTIPAYGFGTVKMNPNDTFGLLRRRTYNNVPKSCPRGKLMG